MLSLQRCKRCVSNPAPSHPVKHLAENGAPQPKSTLMYLTFGIMCLLSLSWKALTSRTCANMFCGYRCSLCRRSAAGLCSPGFARFEHWSRFAASIWICHCCQGPRPFLSMLLFSKSLAFSSSMIVLFVGPSRGLWTMGHDLGISTFAPQFMSAGR